MEIMASTGTSALRVTKTSTKYEMTYTCMHTKEEYTCMQESKAEHLRAHAQADMPMARACMYVCITSCTWRTSAMIIVRIADFWMPSLDERKQCTLGALGQKPLFRLSGQKGSPGQ